MNKRNKTLTILVVVLALVLGAGVGGLMWYQKTHVKVNGIVFEVDIDHLDLRGQQTSVEEYENLRAALPDCAIEWDVPFQGQYLPEETDSLTVTELTEEDLDRMAYFPGLTHVDATGCRDYPAILRCMDRYPGLTVDYVVELGGQTLPGDTAELRFAGDEVDADSLEAMLPYLKNLTAVHLEDPAIPAADIYALQEAYPEVAFTWTKTVYGQTPDIHVTELDLSDGSPDSLQEVEELAAYFPDLELLYMGRTGFDNDSMAAFRDKMRPQYKVVWMVKIGAMEVRSDVTYFMPGKGDKPVHNKDIHDVRYLEDLIAVDLGHQGISDMSWIEGTPHLKYLVLGHGGPSDITPLSSLKELVFLELFMCGVRDLTPLIGCTALEDLNMGGTAFEIDGLLQMPWLKNLWAVKCSLNQSEREALTEALPDTNIQFNGGQIHGYGWRKLPNYYKMRDELGMWYMD